MRSSFLLVAILSACTFNTRGTDGTDGTDNTDATDDDPLIVDASPSDANPPDATVDAAPEPICVGTGVVQICGLATDATSVTLGATFNTTNDLLCSELVTGAPDACVVWATDVTISQNLRVTGNRPLVIAAIMSITSTNDIVASSAASQIGPGANPDDCAVTSHPENDGGGGGGGAGGSLRGRGGNGGTGDTNTDVGNDGNAPGGVSSEGVDALTTLRGGCPGDKGGDENNDYLGGSGGSGGGAIALLSNGLISIKLINAAGEGGSGGVHSSGGGGGGSGGSIVIDGLTVAVSGGLYANGGGGGGGAWNRDGVGNDDGGAGANGYPSTARAAGGAGGSYSGKGGAGSSAADNNGVNGSSAWGAGGGGGGGAGFVYVYGAGADAVITSPVRLP